MDRGRTMTDEQKEQLKVNQQNNSNLRENYYHSSMPNQNKQSMSNLYADSSSSNMYTEHINQNLNTTNNLYNSSYNQTIDSQNRQINYSNYEPINPYENRVFMRTKKPSFGNVLSTIIGFPVFHILILNISYIIISIFYLFFHHIDLTNLDNVYEVLLNSDMQNYSSILMAIICIPIYLIYLHNRNKKYQGTFSTEKIKIKNFLSSSIAVFGSLGLVTLLIAFLEYIGRNLTFVNNWLDYYEDLANTIVSDETNIILQICGTVIFVPIVEELLFRGIVLGKLDQVLSPKMAILIQALLFGLFHMNPIQSLYTFIPGLLLGIIYYQTKNIIVPIAGHMIFNFFGGVIYFIVSENSAQILSIIQLIIGVFTLFLILHFFIKEKPKSLNKNLEENNMNMT